MSVRTSLYIIIAVLGVFLMVSKVADTSFPMATVIPHADGAIVQWSTQARTGFHAIALGFLVIAGFTAWRKVWLASAVFGGFGVFILVIIYTMLLRSNIELLADRVEFRDRPRYFSDPLVLPYRTITVTETVRVNGDVKYRFELSDGGQVELGENPLLDKAWPLILEHLAATVE